jgi:hypothetical protein
MHKASIAEENDRLRLPSDFTPSTLRFSKRPSVHNLDSTGQHCYACTHPQILLNFQNIFEIFSLIHSTSILD